MFSQPKYSLTQAVKDLENKLNDFQQQFPIEAHQEDAGYVKAMLALRGLLDIYAGIDHKQNYSLTHLKGILQALIDQYAKIGSAENDIHAIDVTGPYSFLLAQHHLKLVNSFYHVYEPHFKTVHKSVAFFINMLWRGCTIYLDKKAQKEAGIMEKRMAAFAEDYKGDYYQLASVKPPSLRPQCR